MLCLDVDLSVEQDQVARSVFLEQGKPKNCARLDR